MVIMYHIINKLVHSFWNTKLFLFWDCVSIFNYGNHPVICPPVWLGVRELERARGWSIHWRDVKLDNTTSKWIILNWERLLLNYIPHAWESHLLHDIFSIGYIIKTQCEPLKIKRLESSKRRSRRLADRPTHTLLRGSVRKIRQIPELWL